VRKGNGDGTVPLVSLGLHCRKGWTTKALNPAGFSIVTHELKHDAVPMYQDPRHADLPQFPMTLTLTLTLTQP